MKIETTEENGVTILVLDGRLETATAAIFDQTYSAAFASGARKFVLDCTALKYINSAGLRSILQALKQLSANSGKLAVASPGSMVLEIFEISGFKFLLTIRPDRPAAVAALT
jgi:anti-sigma B factor antagonist